MDVAIAWLLWAGAGLAAVAVIVAVTQPAKRRVALVIAALLFLPIGVFGILSVGALFLGAAMLCLVLASRAGASGQSVTTAKREPR